MSLIIAAVVLSTALQGSGAAPVPANGTTAAQSAQETAASAAAREWVALTDAGMWDESWRAASALFRSQIDAAGWAAAVRPVRQPLGAVSARALKNAALTTTLPGAPAGEYVLVEFGTDFAHKPGSVETVVMMREGGAWKVAGYFIR